VKKNALVIALLVVLSIISGYLMSNASLVGKAGMSLFYQEYNFLKVWWQGALAVFAVLILLFILLYFLQQKVSFSKIKTICILFSLAGLLGLYLTYYDFRHTLSHRFLGERFHLGAYLFWIGWIAVSIYYFSVQQRDHYTIHVNSVE